MITLLYYLHRKLQHFIYNSLLTVSYNIIYTYSYEEFYIIIKRKLQLTSYPSLHIALTILPPCQGLNIWRIICTAKCFFPNGARDSGALYIIYIIYIILETTSALTMVMRLGSTLWIYQSQMQLHSTKLASDTYINIIYFCTYCYSNLFSTFLWISF